MRREDVDLVLSGSWRGFSHEHAGMEIVHARLSL
jgi:hypothetical protein